jgi:adenylate cyclase
MQTAAKRFLLFSFILTAQLTVLFALPADQSHLLEDFKKNPNDSSLHERISDEILQIAFTDPDLSIIIAREILSEALLTKSHEMVARMYMYAGIGFYLKGMYDSAFAEYEQGLAVADEHDLRLLRGDLYNNYSISLAVTGQLGASIEMATSALAIFENARDSTRLARIYNNLGSRYSELDMQEIALSYYLKAANISELRGDRRRLVLNYGNIGLLHYELQNYPDALEYLYMSLNLQDTVQNQMDYCNTLHHLALVYQQMQQFEKALALEKRAYDIAVSLNDDLGLVPILRGMAAIKRNTGNPERSLEYLNRAEELAKNVGARYFLVNIYEELAETYAILNQYEAAFDYKQLHSLLKDSIQWIEKNKALTIIQQIEAERKEREIQLLTKDSEIKTLNLKRQRVLKNSATIVGALLLLLAVLIFHRYRYVRKTNNELAEKNVIINTEKDRSDKLLLNILPAETAEELKANGFAQARQFELVTVMFTDFIGFTQMAENMAPHELVSEIDHCFKQFDLIISRHNIEKIKTIGDAYMCAGGLPVPNTTNPVDVVKAATEIQQFMNELKAQRMAENRPYFSIRIGIHTGPVVAGVVGFKKYQYDIWGDTVNLASRMESSGESGKVNISQVTYEHVKSHFVCVHRGKIVAKNKGSVDMYYVEIEKQAG